MELEKIIIRKFSLDDVDDLYKVLSSEKVMQYIEPVFSLEKTTNFIKKFGMGDNPRVYAIEYNNTVIGHAIFAPFKENAFEIGWIIGENYWGKGIATAITKELIKMAEERKITELIIECSPKQKVTIHIAEKFGFTLLEKNADLLIFQLTLEY